MFGILAAAMALSPRGFCQQTPAAQPAIGDSKALSQLVGENGAEARPGAPQIGEPVAVAPAASAVQVFQGEARWTKDDDSGFDNLEQAGVERSAEEDAVGRCSKAGFLNCVRLSSSIDYCVDASCKAVATAREVEVRAGAGYQTKEGSAEWNHRREGWSDLEILGVQKLAEDDAVARCKAEGLLDCVAVGVRTDGCNLRYWDDDMNQFRYSCKATAAARGYQP